jgi:hypothetical protein
MTTSTTLHKLCVEDQKQRIPIDKTIFTYGILEDKYVNVHIPKLSLNIFNYEIQPYLKTMIVTNSNK